MEKEKTLETIGLLKMGVNPSTGELLDKTHLISKEEIKEALHYKYIYNPKLLLENEFKKIKLCHDKIS